MSVIFLPSFPIPPPSEGAHDVADYNVTVTTDAGNDQTVVVQIIGRDIRSVAIADAVARATRAGLEAKTPPASVTINVNGTTLSSDELAQAVRARGQRDEFCERSI